MAELLGPKSGASEASSIVIFKPEAGDLREGGDRGPEMGWRPDLQDEMPEVKKSEAGRDVCCELQKARLGLFQIRTGHYITGQYLR